MQNFIRDRIRDRLAATGLNPFEAARLAGHERTFINDLMIGKKSTIRQAAIPQVAAALDCDPEYLIGAQDEPRRMSPQTREIAPLAGNTGLPLVGIAEAGTWRQDGAQIAPQSLPVPVDSRHPVSAQVAYLVRGDHAAALGATDGSVVVGLRGAEWRDGDVVIVHRSRIGDDGPEAEITLRKVSGVDLMTGDGRAVKSTAQGVQIAARAVSSYKIF